MTTDGTPPTAAILYSHDSAEHIRLVTDFAHELRSEGVDARLDRFARNPDLTWPAWMESMVRFCDFVLIVCTEAYDRRIKNLLRHDVGGVPPAGSGVVYEYQLIQNDIYLDPGRRGRYFPILFKDTDRRHVPLLLAGNSYFVVNDGQNRAELLDLLFRGRPPGVRGTRLPPANVRSEGIASVGAYFDVLICHSALEGPSTTREVAERLRDATDALVGIYRWDDEMLPSALRLARNVVLLAGEGGEGFGPFEDGTLAGGLRPPVEKVLCFRPEGAGGVTTLPACDCPVEGVAYDRRDPAALVARVLAATGVAPRRTPRPSALEPLDTDLLEIEVGTLFRVYNRKGEYREVEWNFTGNVPQPADEVTPEEVARMWKRVHSLTEKFYRPYAGLRLLAEQARVSSGDHELAKFKAEINKYLVQIGTPFRHLDMELRALPAWMKSSLMYDQLSEVHRCRDALKQNLANPERGRNLAGFLLIEQIGEWLLDALHQADLEIANYLEGVVS